MILITGCTGYIGSRITKDFLAQGKKVIGVTLPKERGSDIADELIKNGVKMYWFDITETGWENFIEEKVDEIYHFAGIHSSFDKMKKLYVDGTKNTLELAVKKNCEFVLIASNSAVYGSNNLECKEEEECDPEHTFGEITLDMEQVCKSYYADKNLPIVIIRIAEVYGKITEELKRMKSHSLHLIGYGSNYTSRVHIEDLSNIVLLAKPKLKKGQIYNVVDIEPVEQRVFYRCLAENLNLMLPTWLEDPCSERIKQSIHGLRALSIKMSAEKLVRETGYDFIYPTYREGIRSLNV